MLILKRYIILYQRGIWVCHSFVSLLDCRLPTSKLVNAKKLHPTKLKVLLGRQKFSHAHLINIHCHLHMWWHTSAHLPWQNFYWFQMTLLFHHFTVTIQVATYFLNKLHVFVERKCQFIRELITLDHLKCIKVCYPFSLVLFLFFLLEYSCCTMLYKLPVYSMFTIFKGRTSSVVIVKHLLYSPCYTICILL